MYINQISVFLENKPGKLAEFIRFLADHQIDLKALCIAETSDYGLLRVIVDKPAQTQELLREMNWPSAMTEVLAVHVKDEPGSLTRLLSILGDNGISLEYTYAFLSRSRDQACIVLRVDDNEKATEILRNAGIDC